MYLNVHISDYTRYNDRVIEHNFGKYFSINHNTPNHRRKLYSYRNLNIINNDSSEKNKEKLQKQVDKINTLVRQINEQSKKIKYKN